MLAVELSTMALMQTVLYARILTVYGAAAQILQYVNMQHTPIPTVVLAAALSACSLQPEVLNSERIKDRFGTYGVEIIDQNDSTRRSNLYSTHDGVSVSRTYAVVEFVGSNIVDMSEVHDKVIDGASIGSTLKDDGWQIRKETIYVGTLDLPGLGHPIAQLMRLQKDADLAVHAYNLHIEKASMSVQYATIIETHHPAYLTESELRQLYSTSTVTDADEINRIHQLVLQQSRD
jgi:hypothetical protein